jgi:predicted transcriptional regulator
MHANKGYGIAAWDENELQKRVDDLVDKGLIEKLPNVEYQISDKGLEWQDDGLAPV